MSSAIPDPVIPLAAAAKFLSLAPQALQALSIGTDNTNTSYRFSSLMRVLQARQRTLDSRSGRR